MKVFMSRAADRAMRRLRKGDRRLADRIDEAIDGLATDPRPHGCKMLAVAGGAYRIRVGQWRVVYEIDDAAERVTVQVVAKRGQLWSEA